MFRNRSCEKEWMDDSSLDSVELKKNLLELELYNHWLGGEQVIVSALNKIRKQYATYFAKHKIVIADLCCGGGDLLKVIEKWAIANQIKVELIGIDINPFMIRYAREQAGATSHIQFKTLDIFAAEFSQLRFDIVCINSSCHHFSDTAIVELFKTLSRQTRLSILINDLQRHWLSYAAIRILTALLPFSSLAKHDAPLSVLRSFRKKELITFLQQAELFTYQLTWAWAFRWELIIWLANGERDEKGI